MTHTTSVKQPLKQGLTLFLYELKKSRTPLIIFAVVGAFFLTVIFSLTSMSARTFSGYAGEPLTAEDAALMNQSALTSFQTIGATAVFVLTCIFTIIFTLRVFSYLHNKRKADRLQPLPVKASVLFLAKALAAFAAAVIPALVFNGVICLISACFGVPVHTEVLLLFVRIPLGSAACIAFYGLMAVCCGSSVNTLLSFLAICLCYPLATGFIRGMMQSFFFGLPSDTQRTHFVWKALNPLSAYDGAHVLYWLLFTVACCALSLLLLRRRKAERAQTSFAYRLPCYAVEMLITFIAGVLLGVVFASYKVTGAAFPGFVFGFLLGGGTAFFIAHVILFKGFARILKSLIGYGAISAATIGFTAICCLASPAYADNLPARSQIQSAGYVEYDFEMASIPALRDPMQLMNGSAKDFTDKSSVNCIYDEQQRLVSRYQKSSTEKKFRNVIIQSFSHLLHSLTGYAVNEEYFAYTLTDGSTFTRSYDVSMLQPSMLDMQMGENNTYGDYYYGNMSEITQSPTYLAKYSALGNMTAADIAAVNISHDRTEGYSYLTNTANTRADLQTVFDAVQADYIEHGMADTNSDLQLWFETQPGAVRSGITAFSLLSANQPVLNGINGDILCIPQTYKRTRAALQTTGILTADGKLNTQSAYYVKTDGILFPEDDLAPTPWDSEREIKQGDVIAVGTGMLTMPFPCERKITEGLDCFYDTNGALLLFESRSITEVYYDDGTKPGTAGKNAFADSFQVLRLETKDTKTMPDGCFGTAKVKADGKELTLRYIQFGKTVGDQVFYCTDKLSDEAFAQLQTSFSVGYPDEYNMQY